tara:strand:- start:76526 stop:78106 length:1581 start_codon:yes stop_codon:yes gene_type:complete
MRAFADLLDNLIHTPQRNGKLRLLTNYFDAVSNPDRGWALAVLTGEFVLPGAKASMVRELVAKKVDPTLFEFSYEYVGDLAETVSLLWPDTNQNTQNICLSLIIKKLQNTSRRDFPALVSETLDHLTIPERFAFLKLIMGGLRVGVSARLSKVALAEYGGKPVSEIEELWYGLKPPYGDLFDWLEGKAPIPQIDQSLVFRPMMLANPIRQEDFVKLKPSDFISEWKWDGIRALLVADGSDCRLYSRTGDNIGRAFPDILNSASFIGVLDGELLVARDGIAAPFAELQKRLGRKTTTKKLLTEHPAHFRVYDILFDEDEDLRAQPLEARRKKLETWTDKQTASNIDLSPLVLFKSWQELSEIRDGTRGAGIEGLMLKRRDSPYIAGRPKGPWFKWKRDPLVADCVLMYAQRGHGKRSSYYSDYTFGCWRASKEGEDELVPVGKAYSGFTNEELVELDRWVRAHATDRFGPVRAVERGLVFEVAFDAIQSSKRHKSGLAMRFPRIHRIRWDKTPNDADRVETLETLVE